MKIIRVLFALFLVQPLGAPAAVLPEGTGIMYDANYSFELSAPKGWVLDSDAAMGHGVCAVFYPVGSSWADGQVVFYVNTKQKTAKMRDAQDAVDEDLADFHGKGSRNSKAEKIKEMKLKNGRVASVWQYTGDQWGNYERTAFVVEEKGISCVVMSARTEKEMDGAIPAFEQLVASYEYVGSVKITK